MRDEWETYARGAAAAADILRAIYGVEVRKALNPLKLKDFEFIVRSLATSLKGHVVPVEDAALKQAMGKLDAKWTDLSPEARAKVIGEAAHYLGPPVAAKVLPKIDQTLAFAAKDIVPTTKQNAVLTYDLKISPDLNATDERIANYVRVSQGHFITNRYGERADAFAGQARGIVAAGLEKGLGSADIAEDLRGALGGETGRGLGYWNTIAMVFANRARTMTQLASYHEAGIESYVWESVLDEATSVQCRFMHGRRFPVAGAMRRFQDVENAESPEDIKTLQPFMSLGREGENQALVFGSGDTRQVVANVVTNAVGRADDEGMYSDIMSDEALAKAGITAPPIHGNCRSTIIPEFGSAGGGGGGRVVPPPPRPEPERLTPGARKARALDDLHALPLVNGGADASSLFVKGYEPDPSFLTHPMFADHDAGGALGALWQENATNKRPQLDDLIATAPTFDKGVTEKLLMKPRALADAPAPKVVQYEGKLYVIDGHEQLAAQKLLGQKVANCDFVNLDKALKPAPLISPLVPGPAPLPPSVIVPTPHPPPPPSKKVDMAPPPPPPRLFRQTLPPVVDPETQRKKIAALLPKDVAITAGKTQDEQDRLELGARKKLKAYKRQKGQVAVGLPTEQLLTPEEREALGGYDAQTTLFRIGIDGRKATMAAAKVDRVAIEDYVASAAHCYKSTAEEAIHELVKHGEFRMPDAEDEYRDGPPVLVRIGNRLFPYMGGKADPQMAGAKALGLKTLEARVIDANPKLAELLLHGNAEVIGRQAARDQEYVAELERIRVATEAREQREQIGAPEVVAVRAKHRPADYAAKFVEGYQEAAPSLGWGHAMQERGLDFPLEHLERVARQFEGEPPKGMDTEFHPLMGIAPLLRRQMHVGGKTLRESMDIAASRMESIESQPAKIAHAEEQRALKSAAAILAHVDAIAKQDGFKILEHDLKVGAPERTAAQTTWFAGLIDRSVSLPDLRIKFTDDDRAFCQTYSITSWRDKAALVALPANERTKTVFHEVGHAIDAADRGRGIRASAFLDARTAGDSLVNLRELTGLNYKPEEVARTDKFYNPYIGRQYAREPPAARYDEPYYGPKAPQKATAETDRVHDGTEVTSMAVEKIVGWRRALDEDPEHFLFGLGQLGGY